MDEVSEVTIRTSALVSIVEKHKSEIYFSFAL